MTVAIQCTNWGTETVTYHSHLAASPTLLSRGNTKSSVHACCQCRSDRCRQPQTPCCNVQLTSAYPAVRGLSFPPADVGVELARIGNPEVVWALRGFQVSEAIAQQPTLRALVPTILSTDSCCCKSLNDTLTVVGGSLMRSA